MEESQESKKIAFIEALTQKYAVYHAATTAGISRATAYRWREADEEFAKAWEDAQADAVDALETSLYERAMRSDTIAAIFLLKGARPHVYRERYEVTGKDGGPLIAWPVKEGDDVP